MTSDAPPTAAAASREPGSRPRVLVVTDRAPGITNGHALRVKNVIEGLRHRFDLHVLLIDVNRAGGILPTPNGYELTRVRADRAPRWARVLRLVGRLPTDVHYRSQSALRRRIREAVGNTKWDVVWYSRGRTYALASGLFEARTIVDFDDLNDLLLLSVIEERQRRQRGPFTALQNAWDRLDARRWTASQHRFASETDVQVVCKASDRDYLGTDDVAIVPNSYPEPGDRRRARRPHARPPSAKPRIFFAGSLLYAPNRFGVEWLAREVMPLISARHPSVVLDVVGRIPHSGAKLRAEPNCVVHGFVDDIAPHIEAATIAVAPLWSGGGTRLKVIESLAWGVPLVATAVAVEGFDIVEGSEALVADDAHEFANACVRILDDPDLALRLSRNGRARYESSLVETACGAAAAEVVDSVLASERTRSRRR